jgi:hypothetical protein
MVGSLISPTKPTKSCPVALEILDADGMTLAWLSDWTLEELAEGVSRRS